MKIFIKFTAAILCGILATSVLTSCKADKKEDSTASEKTSATETTKATTTAPPETTTEEIHTPDINYYVRKTEAVDAKYFDDVVFVGDSISYNLYYYNLKTKHLGNAEFVVSYSLGVANSQWSLDEPTAVHPVYNGVKMRVADAVKETGRKKVYILLGINDIYLYGVDSTVETLQVLVGQIKESTPDAQIVLQSVTPVYKKTTTGITNELVNDYNEKVSALCKEQGWYYLDIATALRDEDGTLRAEFCSDPGEKGIHLKDAGCKAWAEYLCEHSIQEATAAQ